MVNYESKEMNSDNINLVIDNFYSDCSDNLFDESANKLMYDWENYGFVKKDLSTGDVLNVKEIHNIGNNKINVLLDCGLSIQSNLKKEKKFFEFSDINFNDLDELNMWIESEECQNWLNNNQIKFKVEVNNSIISGSIFEAYLDDLRIEFIDQLKKQSYVYEAFIKSKNKGGFLVNVNGIDAFLPGGLASTNKIDNFDSFIGKKIPVMIEDYLQDSDIFIVSNKKYVARILPEKVKELEFTKLYKGKITGTANYGIFVEFDEIFTGLLHQTEMDQNTLELFNKNKIKINSEIEFYIKKVDNPYRIILTQNIEDSIKRLTFNDFKIINEGKWIYGEISNLSSYGSFIRFTIENNNFIGLLHYKAYQEGFRPEVGDTIKVYIRNVDVENKKIYLEMKNN